MHFSHCSLGACSVEKAISEQLTAFKKIKKISGLACKHFSDNRYTMAILHTNYIIAM